MIMMKMIITYLDVLKLKHISPDKCVFDFLIGPCNEQLIVVIGLKMTIKLITKKIKQISIFSNFPFHSVTFSVKPVEKKIGAFKFIRSLQIYNKQEVFFLQLLAARLYSHVCSIIYMASQSVLTSMFPIICITLVLVQVQILV